MKNNQYYGIIPPMVTPLEDWDKLDYQGIEKLINHILKGGVHGLFVLGTTGCSYIRETSVLEYIV